MDIPTDFDTAQFFECHPDPMWIFDVETLAFLAVNDAAIAQYGYSREEFRAMSIADIRPGGDVDALRSAVDLRAKGHGAPELWWHRRKSGDVIPVEVAAQSVTLRGRAARLVVARDARAQVGFTASHSRAQSRLRQARWELDLERNEARWSPSVFAIFGLNPLSWSNTRADFFDLLHPDDRDRYGRTQEAAIRSGTLFDIQYRARDACGAELVLHEVGEVIRVSGRPIFSAVVQDVTEFVRARAVSEQLEARMGEVLEGMSDAFCLLDRDWSFAYINRNAEALLGKDRAALSGHTLWAMLPDVVGTRFETCLREARATGTSGRVTAFHAPWDKFIELTAHPGREDLAIYFRDVTGEVRAAAQRQLVNAAIARLNDVVLIIEAGAAPGQPGNTIIYANEAVRKMTGYAPEDLVGRTPDILHGPDTPGPALDQLHAALGGYSHTQVEIINYTVHGTPYWVEIDLSPILDEAGICTHFIVIQRDITERKNAEQALRLAATRDSLTGLLNRAAFTETLEQKLKSVRAGGATLALLFVDIDNFKNINDSLGHGFGDALLLAISRRLAAGAGHAGHLARFAGDEFIVVAPDADMTAARALAERLIDGFMAPFHVNGERISLTASIGIVVAPEDGEDAETLIRKADMAMYRSKAAGRNQATQFDEALNREVQRTLGLTQAMQQALITGDGFSLVYQPQVSLDETPRLAGAEALLRWHDPERGTVCPAEFIPAAERAGLITMLDRHVIEMAVRQIGTWNRQGHRIKLSVNVSTNTLEWDGLADFILGRLEAHAVSPSLFGVEIIETRRLESSRTTIGNLLALRRAGIAIAIDDFGTGHSSLSYLQDLPVDILKIDQSFVRRLDEGNRQSMALVQAILAMAQALGLGVVAEGVETEAQRSWLTQNGCGVVQGFLLGRPLAPAAFAQAHFAGVAGVA